jgi:hypothetical protein
MQHFSISEDRIKQAIANTEVKRIFYVDNDSLGLTSNDSLGFVVETVRTVKNVFDHWRIESIIL